MSITATAATATTLYDAIVAHLHAPKQRTLDLVEHLHPHTPPIPEDCPDPGTDGGSRQARRAFVGWLGAEYRQRIAAVIAAEMVLPIWEEWAASRNRVDVAAPREAIAIVRRYLEGDATTEEMAEVRRRCYAAYYAAASASADFAAHASYASYAASAAADAAYSAYSAGHADAYSDFLRAWRRRVLCALAWVDHED